MNRETTILLRINVWDNKRVPLNHKIPNGGGRYWPDNADSFSWKKLIFVLSTRADVKFLYFLWRKIYASEHSLLISKRGGKIIINTGGHESYEEIDGTQRD